MTCSLLCLFRELSRKQTRNKLTFKDCLNKIFSVSNFPRIRGIPLLEFQNKLFNKSEEFLGEGGVNIFPNIFSSNFATASWKHWFYSSYWPFWAKEGLNFWMAYWGPSSVHVFSSCSSMFFPWFSTLWRCQCCYFGLFFHRQWKSLMH